MNDLLKYITRKQADFNAEPFCEIDGIIFSWFSYLVLPEEAAILCREKGICIRDLFRLEYFQEMFSLVLLPDTTEWFLSLLAASPRFRDIRITDYQNQLDKENDMQFTAMTFHLPGQELFISYRGTDVRFTGWKEDMELALDKPIPSQNEALRYLEEMGLKYPDHSLIVGGHSKGGNLAVFASSYCMPVIQNRIRIIYSIDGPGFLSPVLLYEGFRVIHSRCRKLVPQSSLVGLLMDDDVEFEVVKSTGRGIMQHSPFTWVIEGDQVVRMESLSAEAKIIERGLDLWLGDMPLSERTRFINSVFEVLEETGAEDFQTLSENIKTYLPVIRKQLEGMEKEEKIFLIKSLAKLAHFEIKSIPFILKEMSNERDFSGLREITSLSLLGDSEKDQK